MHRDFSVIGIRDASLRMLITCTFTLSNKLGRRRDESIFYGRTGNARGYRAWCCSGAGLHAQGKPPVYLVTEIDVTNVDAYVKEYAPLVAASIKKAGGKLVAASLKVSQIEGTPPKRVAIQVWDSLDQIQAWRNGADYKDARKIGDKYATFRSYAVEGMPQ